MAAVPVSGRLLPTGVARGAGRRGGLRAYAILEDGRKVLLHLALGSRESYDARLGFLHDIMARGLKKAPWARCFQGYAGSGAWYTR